MDNGSVAIARLGPSEAEAYNALLFAGALAHPDTLRFSPEDLSANPFTLPATPDCATFAVRVGGAMAGVVTLERERGRVKRRHIAWVLRMYVPRAHAGQGFARALLRAAIAEARRMPGVDKLNLTVAAHNMAAVGLYSSEGFREFAREEDAFRDAVPRTELSMSLRL